MGVLAIVGGLGLVACLLDWRKGLLLCLAVGFLQDPLRKVTPGQPVAFVVLVGIFFVGCALGFLLEQGGVGIRRFFRWYPGLKPPIVAFVGVVLASSVWTIVSTGNPIVAAIGLLSYLSPLVALFLGQQFCSTPRAMGRWQKVYLAGALAVGISILMAFLGVESRLLESIGETTVYGRGGRIEMVSGLLRSSENASWHTATAACLVIVWSVARRRTRAFWVGIGATLVLLLAVVLTGRRKTLGEVLLFVVFFAFLLTRSRFGASRLYRIVAAMAIGAAVVVSILVGTRSDSAWAGYFERSFSVVTDAPERLESMAGLEQLSWIIRDSGFIGRGVGTGAQGAQYFGGGAALGWGAEGGLGRVLSEVGVPGVLAGIWLAVALWRRLWRIASVFSRGSADHAVRFYGLVSLLPANAVVFLTAHQVFGDPFVLIVLGIIASSTLAFPQLMLSERVAEEARHRGGTSTPRGIRTRT